MGYILAVLVGLSAGWVWAHYSIANECERLGGFYIGKKVFKCHRVEEK